MKIAVALLAAFLAGCGVGYLARSEIYRLRAARDRRDSLDALRVHAAIKRRGGATLTTLAMDDVSLRHMGPGRIEDALEFLEASGQIFADETAGDAAVYFLLQHESPAAAAEYQAALRTYEGYDEEAADDDADEEATDDGRP